MTHAPPRMTPAPPRMTTARVVTTILRLRKPGHAYIVVTTLAVVMRWGGRHGGGACVMRGEAVIIAYTSSSISPAESHHTSTLHRATLLRASTPHLQPFATLRQSPHNAPVASLAQNLQSHLALSL